MQITIDRPDLERFVEEQVKTGHYPSPQAVVENALATLKIHEATLPAGEELCRLIAEGQLAADEGRVIPGPQVFRELREHSAKYQAAHKARQA